MTGLSAGSGQPVRQDTPRRTMQCEQLYRNVLPINPSVARSPAWSTTRPTSRGTRKTTPWVRRATVTPISLASMKSRKSTTKQRSKRLLRPSLMD